MIKSPERNGAEPPFTEILAGIATTARDLAAAHAEQLRVELRTKADRAQAIAGWMATGLALFTLGLAFGLVSLVMMLTEKYGWSATAAWATVGGLAAVMGAAVGLIGRRQWQQERFTPNRTLQSLRESLTWITTLPH